MAQSTTIPRRARSLSLLVMETGARWPAELVGAHSSSDCVALGQYDAETPLGFSRRVVARLEQLVASGASVRLGVLSAGEERSDLASDARYRITRALIAASSPSEAPELVLVARADRGPRHDLFGLAGVLCETLGADGSVRVRLGGDVAAQGQAA